MGENKPRKAIILYVDNKIFSVFMHFGMLLNGL